MRCHEALGKLCLRAVWAYCVGLLCAVLGGASAAAASDVPPARFADPARRATRTPNPLMR